MPGLLDALNRPPIAVTLPHMYERGLLSAHAWDDARFGDDRLRMPWTRKEWLVLCFNVSGTIDGHDPRLLRRAAAVHAVITAMGSCGVTSFGVGDAALEFHLAQRGMKVWCVDYAELATRALRGLFHEAVGVDCGDIRTYDWTGHRGPVLLHRIDPHLSNKEWRSVFAAMAQHVPRVIFIPNSCLTVLSILQMVWNRVTTRGLSRAGWKRTAAAFEALWDGFYVGTRMDFGGSVGWVLETR